MSADKENTDVYKSVLHSKNGKDMPQKVAINTSEVDIETQADLRDQLYAIELNTKQSRVDLNELVNRSKNNNENLNKLLNSLVQSRGASKEDIRDIFNQKQPEFSGILDRLKDQLIAGQNETQKETSKWQQEIRQALKMLEEKLEGNIDQTWQEEIKTLILGLQDKIDRKNETTHKEEALEDLQQKHTDLETKYNNLSMKYDELCKLYTNKYESFQALQKQYEQLIHQTKQEIKPNYDALDKLSALHAQTLSRTAPKVQKKRIVSTPTSHE